MDSSVKIFGKKTKYFTWTKNGKTYRTYVEKPYDTYDESGKRISFAELKRMGFPKGGGIDVHKAIGKLPKPKGGWTLPGHKYTGPYNDLDSQLKYNPQTGEILEIYDKPTGKTDAIAMQHDVDYSVCKDNKKCKNKADRKLVEALDSVPYNERQWDIGWLGI